jgi:hypothetical protein
VSQIRTAIAGVVHRWFVENTDIGCEGHPPPLHHLYPDCEQIADRIIGELDWPDADL